VGIDGLRIEARASVPREGVWGLDGRETALTAITGPGLQVDGVRVALDELEALATLSIPGRPSAELATDGAIEAWAELEHESLPRSGGETRVVVRLRASDAAASVPRGRLRVHLVIDRSSSMQRSWERVLAAARALIGRLHADDELQIVAYGTDAIEAFPIGRVGDGQAAIAALGRVSVGGGTNIEAGLERAYAAAAGASAGSRSLVILLSDGVPTQGACEPTELGALATAARISGATTSVVGLGTEFDARLLRAVARSGHGGYHVSASLDALADGLVEELEAHARMAARGVQVRVTLGDGVEILGVAEGDATQVDGGVVLSTPHLDAGEERRIVLSVRVPAGARAREVAEVSLDYRSGLSGRAVSASLGLDVSFGARAVLATEGAAARAVLDTSLSSSLDLAGNAIARGDALAAQRALDAHAELAEGRVEYRRSEALQARARVVRRLGEAVHALVPGASHPQRRQVANAFGELAVRFGR
jgi:Ca-activated chloride channel family protein